MLEIMQGNKRFAQKDILRDFSLALAQGKTTCVLGPSGCGKTTLLRVMAGLLPPDSGRVTGLLGLRSSFVFQEDRLLPWYNALENITALGVGEDAARKALADVLLQGDADVLPENLSGGMRRRLAIARALAYGGDCFFLDEPLRGLDPATAAPVLAAMREALAGKTALLITHSAEEAYALSDRLLLVQGPPIRVVAAADTKAFENVEAVKRWLAPDFE